MSNEAGALAAGHLTSRLSRLAARLAGLSGWRRYGLSAALGILAAAAMPPVHFLAALPIAFSGLVWLLGGSGRGRQGGALRRVLRRQCEGFAELPAEGVKSLPGRLLLAFGTEADQQLLPSSSGGYVQEALLLGRFKRCFGFGERCRRRRQPCVPSAPCS